MWYAIEGYDGADVLERRLAARPAHLERLLALRDAGRLLLAGPCPDRNWTSSPSGRSFVRIPEISASWSP